MMSPPRRRTGHALSRSDHRRGSYVEHDIARPAQRSSRIISRRPPHLVQSQRRWAPPPSPSAHRAQLLHRPPFRSRSSRHHAVDAHASPRAARDARGEADEPGYRRPSRARRVARREPRGTLCLPRARHLSGRIGSSRAGWPSWRRACWRSSVAPHSVVMRGNAAPHARRRRRCSPTLRPAEALAANAIIREARPSPCSTGKKGGVSPPSSLVASRPSVVENRRLPRLLIARQPLSDRQSGPARARHDRDRAR